MPVLRATALIDAPQRTVAGLLGDAALISYTQRRVGHAIRLPERFLSVGDEVQFGLRLGPGLLVPITTRIIRADLDGMASTLVAGLPRRLEHVTTLAGTLAGTLVTDEVRWTSPFGLLGRVVDVVLLRRVVLRLLVARCADLTRRGEQLAGPRAGGQVVVCAAIVRAGRLLVGQRREPADAAGRWELPGGQVEAGESEAAALIRECHEELGVRVRVGARLGPDLPLRRDRLLRAYLADVDGGTGQLRPLDHAELRWVGVDELDALDWLGADRALVPDLRAALS